MTIRPNPASTPSSDVRVLIVDDSAFMRNALGRMLEAAPGIHVIDRAKDGQEGLEKAKRHKPDVVTLDIEMPVLDGLSALRRMLAEVDPPPAVIMCSSLTTEGSHEALKALRLGASDVIAKPGSHFALGVEQIREDLIAKILGLAGHRRQAGTRVRAPAAAAAVSAENFRLAPGKTDLVVIGSSTGGPPVLEKIIEALPANFPAPIVIAQHMPAMFTKSLAQRLDDQCALTVVQGASGMLVTPGTVYVAEGGLHTRVRRSGLGRCLLEVGPEPASALYRPSANELLASAARASGSKALGIVLTGIGEDGLEGAREIKARGGHVIAQDMDSCVVYGMPRAVSQAGLADASLDPAQIARLLVQMCAETAGERAA